MRPASGLALCTAFLLCSDVAGSLSGGLQDTGCHPVEDQGLEYFDRHNVHCPTGSALRGFRMLRGCLPGGVSSSFSSIVGDSYASIHYICSNNPNMTYNSDLDTGCHEVEDKNLDWLDRHHVDCPNSQVLTHFRMNRVCNGHPGSQARIDYQCSATSIPYACETLFTQCNPVAEHRLEYFDRHNIQCPPGEYLGGWRLTRDGCGGDYLRAKYSCCVESLHRCPISEVTGEWKPKGYTNGKQSFSFTEETTLSDSREVTSAWSWGIEVKVEAGFSFVGTTPSKKVTVTGSYAMESSTSVRSSIQRSSSETQTISFERPGQVWQFEYFADEGVCGSSVIATRDLVATDSTGDYPCCLPGFAEDPSNQHGPCLEGSPCSCDPETCFPSASPSVPPTEAPSLLPTDAPSLRPTGAPSLTPTVDAPSESPKEFPLGLSEASLLNPAEETLVIETSGSESLTEPSLVAPLFFVLALSKLVI